MVAAQTAEQTYQLLAVPVQHLQQDSKLTGMVAVQQQPAGEQQKVEPATTDGNSSNSQHNNTACADGILYFNWDQRATARAAMQTLVAALSDDPVNSYFSGSKRRRRRFVKDEVKGYLKALPSATNFIATPDSQAVALWQLLPAETPRNELWAGWTRILAVPPRLWRQLLRLELKYESAHESIGAAYGSYYYLSFIGTAPEARGRGLGSKLLSEITSRADREGRWCLLEATSEKSEALYARHGFVTYETYRVSSKAPPVFLMKRAPASTPAAAPAAAAAVPIVAVACDLPLVSNGPLTPEGSERVLQAPGASAVTGDLAGDLAAAVASKTGSKTGGAVSPQLVPSSPRLIPVARDGNVQFSDDSSSDEEDERQQPQQQQVELAQQMLAADAQIIISSAGSSSMLKGATDAPAAVAAAGGSNGSSNHGSPVEYGVLQDEAGCDCSSRAGAGGPSGDDAAAC